MVVIIFEIVDYKPDVYVKFGCDDAFVTMCRQIVSGYPILWSECDNEHITSPHPIRMFNGLTWNCSNLVCSIINAMSANGWNLQTNQCFVSTMKEGRDERTWMLTFTPHN